jgi:hypothetical protein
MDHTVDLVILDVMMPRMNGYAVCAELRKRYTVPVLFLTAKSRDSDKTMGFSAGGDDYLVKPFSYNELMNRVKAILRRYYVYGAKASEPSSVICCCGNIEIDTSRSLVRVDGQETGRFSLSEDGTYELNGGTNILRIENGVAYLTDANCPDQLCVHQGKISMTGQVITCLPNKLTVSVYGTEESVDLVS